MTTRSKGDAGEDHAATWLSRQGYHIVKRNLRCRSGEVDIVVYKDASLAFVEVKTWQTLSVADLADSIDGRKRTRIMKCARQFLSEHPEWNAFRIRFDIIHVDSSQNIRHFADAFTEVGFQ